MDLTAKILRCNDIWKILRLLIRKLTYVLSIILLLIYLYLSHLVQTTNEKNWKFVDNPVIEIINLKSFSDNILLKDRIGQLILNKSVKHLWQQPLRKWNYQNEMLKFIHIVKSGGTSFDESLTSSRHKDGCDLQCKPGYEKLLNRTCPSTLDTWCHEHFDWTEVEKVESHGIKTAPVVLLRNPIDRFVSSFYYSKHMPLQSHFKKSNQTLSEYLADPESMLQSQQIWFDGHVSHSFFFEKILQVSKTLSIKDQHTRWSISHFYIC